MRRTASFADAAAGVWSSTITLHLRSTAIPRQPAAARERQELVGDRLEVGLEDRFQHKQSGVDRTRGILQFAQVVQAAADPQVGG